ncbi:Radical SAM domain protein [Verrucomicrobia bacterium]|nr:Radical SAM domain protein [Verrucomicrobiota bacterium]
MSQPLKFLLIKPATPDWRVSNESVGAGRTQMFRYSMLSCLYVAAATPAFVQTRILDEEVEPIDYDTPADLVGLSFMTCSAPRAYQIASRFRREKHKTVIAGGYHPTFMPEEVLQHVDAVCVGEAETIVPRIIEDFLAGSLKTIYRARPAPLAGLPVPDRSLLRKVAYAPIDTVQATRGCPYSCSFCSISAFYQCAFRVRPVDEVIEELKTLGSRLLFMDDNLTSDVGYAKELFRRMIPLRKRWISQASVQIAADAELLSLAARSGCRGLFIGFESLSDDNLRRWRKNFNRSRDYLRIVEKLHSHGIGVCVGMVFGYDWDSAGVFPFTLDFLELARVDAVQATILTPFPGTELFREMNRTGRVIERDWEKYDFSHVIFEPRQMSRQMLQDGHDWFLSQFYSRKAIARRLLRQLGYLCPSTVLGATAPLNLSYRRRLRGVGTLRAFNANFRESHPPAVEVAL